ncbi:MAG: polysaccharide biosynthesis/export family protein [Prolixibacteraceae bacterium]|nr:polysaccharide biosynthesis/export family protein [Prolixibacteraceae bacterium]
MKKPNPILILLGVLIVTISSCRSPKEFTYLQDISKDQHIGGVSNDLPEYKIKPYDNLYVSIKTLNPEVNVLFDPNQSTTSYGSGTTMMYGDNVSQYINGYQVDSLGTISLPILGSIEVAGLTLKQIQNKIQKKSLEFIKDPTIRVKLLSFKVNVSGEVINPGVYYSYNEKFNILEAISMANGVTDNAKIGKVIVIRQTTNGSNSYNIDLTSKKLLASEAYYLQPNDLIYIKPSKNKRMELNTTSYSLFLSTITTILLAVNLFR